MFSEEFKSGLKPGNTNITTLSSPNHCFVSAAVCFGSLSCWNSHSSWYRSRAVGTIDPSRIDPSRKDPSRTEDSGLPITRAGSVCQNVTINIPRQKARKVAAMSVPQANSWQQDKRLVDSEQNLPSESRRAFINDDRYQLQSNEANHKHVMKQGTLKEKQLRGYKHVSTWLYFLIVN